MAPRVNLLAPKLPIPRFAVGDLVEHRASGERAVVTEYLTDYAADHIMRRNGEIDWSRSDTRRYYRGKVYLQRVGVAPTFSDRNAGVKCVFEDELRLVESVRDARHRIRAVVPLPAP